MFLDTTEWSECYANILFLWCPGYYNECPDESQCFSPDFTAKVPSRGVSPYMKADEITVVFVEIIFPTPFKTDVPWDPYSVSELVSSATKGFPWLLLAYREMDVFFLRLSC